MDERADDKVGSCCSGGCCERFISGVPSGLADSAVKGVIGETELKLDGA